MLRPYGLARTYPSQRAIERSAFRPAWIPAFAGMTSYAKVSESGNGARVRRALPYDERENG